MMHFLWQGSKGWRIFADSWHNIKIRWWISWEHLRVLMSMTRVICTYFFWKELCKLFIFFFLSFVNSYSLINCHGLSLDSDPLVQTSVISLLTGKEVITWPPHLELPSFHPSPAPQPGWFLWTQTWLHYSIAWKVLITSCCLRQKFEFLKARHTGGVSLPLAPTRVHRRNVSHLQPLSHVCACNCVHMCVFFCITHICVCVSTFFSFKKTFIFMLFWFQFRLL